MDEASWRDFLAAYLDRGTRLHHPGYLAHQCAVPDIGAALADLVHGVTNNAMSLYEMGAAAATIELVVVEWLLGTLGWEAEGGGVLVHGGSLANLTALLSARAHAFPSAWEQGTPRHAVILAPACAHISVTRGSAILGLGSRAVLPLPADEFGRVRGDLVGATIDSLHRAGRRVLAVVANACAAPTGLYDPLRELAIACKARDVWLHIDAAHGGGALLVPELRYLLDGAEQGDSLTWDAHKMLRTSTLAAAVLVRRREDLHNAFQQSADYLFFGGDHAGPDLMRHTVEGSKAELGLKLFLNLAWRGEKGLADYVRGRYLAARTLWEQLVERDGFEVLCEPESNLVCFRREGDDVQVVEVRDRLMADGSFHLASSVVRGKRWWRATVMAPASDRASFSRLLDTIEAVQR
jgi:L-2,4-diaminobutyrate decarboxylase